MKDEKTVDVDNHASTKATPSTPRLAVESVEKSPTIYTVTGSVSKGFEAGGKTFKTRLAATDYAISLLGGKKEKINPLRKRG